jgi:hypothetical protein
LIMKPLTEAEHERVIETVNQIDRAVHDLVDKMTKDLPPDLDELVRTHLTEQFRFWRHR